MQQFNMSHQIANAQRKLPPDSSIRLTIEQWFHKGSPQPSRADIILHVIPGLRGEECSRHDFPNVQSLHEFLDLQHWSENATVSKES